LKQSSCDFSEIKQTKEVLASLDLTSGGTREFEDMVYSHVISPTG
jgi:hypothetical protein